MHLMLSLLILATQAFGQDLPKIYLVYQPDGTVFDRTCPQFTKTEVKPEWIQETAKRRSEFQSDWDKEGPRYLMAALNEIGLPFPYREMQATLTVCSIGGSLSSPLLLNVRRFLSDAEDPLPPWLFAEIVYHELMHHYTRPVYSLSQLRKKYSFEPLQTQNHLHVMALEKLALLKLGKEAELKFIDRRYRTQAPPTYKRAWEIVNDLEGYEAFLTELKAVPKNAAQP